jgi:hypothetical protein
MSRYFTHYWRNSTWRYNQDTGEGEPLDQTSGNQFMKRGVSQGDIVYVVTVISGKLYLCGRMVVDEIMPTDAAAKHFGCSVDDLWEADEHLISHDAMPMRFSLSLPFKTTMQLRFPSGRSLKQLKCIAPGQLDSQTLRGVRELDEASAHILDEFLEAQNGK